MFFSTPLGDRTQNLSFKRGKLLPLELPTQVTSVVRDGGLTFTVVFSHVVHSNITIVSYKKFYLATHERIELSDSRCFGDISQPHLLMSYVQSLSYPSRLSINCTPFLRCNGRGLCNSDLLFAPTI